MTAKQQTVARIMWFILGCVLVFTACCQPPMIVLSSSLIGWFGGIAFVFAWLVKAENREE